MRVHVKLFAVARQRIGRDSIEVDLPTDPTIGYLRVAIAEQYPPLAKLLPHSRFAIDSDYASDAAFVSANTDIAIIPPVSGG